MKRKLYYSVEKETETNGFEEYLTGMKLVTVYEVEQNQLKKFFDLDLELSDNSIECIQNYIDDNGYEDSEIEFVLL